MIVYMCVCLLCCVGVLLFVCFVALCLLPVCTLECVSVYSFVCCFGLFVVWCLCACLLFLLCVGFVRFLDA